MEWTSVVGVPKIWGTLGPMHPLRQSVSDPEKRALPTC